MSVNLFEIYGKNLLIFSHQESLLHLFVFYGNIKLINNRKEGLRLFQIIK
jgi:hypothetical protein